MRILLAKCPRAHVSHFEENSESLALGYLGAALREHDHEIELLDASLTGLSLSETADKILQGEYDILGFTLADPTFIESTFKVISTLRDNGTKSHIIMGGHSPTFHYREILQMSPGLDSVAMYEGEGTIVELANHLEQGKDWHGIRGLAYRSNNGAECNAPRPLIRNLDDLSFPVRDTLPFLMEHKKETGVVSMAGGRGCYANCGFCSIKAFCSVPGGPSWRLRSNQDIVEEMEYLVKAYGVKEILFIDDVFVGPGQESIERISELADEIEKRKLKVMLSVSERVDNIDEGLFRRLREVGLRQVLLGAESGDQQILDYLGKGITPEQIRRAVDTLQGLDIDISLAFINFTPITRLEQLIENLRFFTGLKLNVLQGMLNRFQIYEGTPLAQKLNSAGLVKGKFPNLYYVSADRRVDVVYEIVQNSFGTFLSVAYELKKLERLLRIRLFEAEAGETYAEAALIKRERIRYQKMMNKIMKEAEELFLEVVNFVLVSGVRKNGNIESFTDRMMQASANSHKEWMRLIQFFRNLSPVLGFPESSRGGKSTQQRRRGINSVRP